MKKYLLGFALLCGVLLQFSPVNAAWVYVATKQISLTIVVTPSPVAYAPAARPTPVIGLHKAFDRPVTRNMIAYEPFRGWDTLGVTSGTVPAALTVKPDPTFAIFHIVPHTPTMNAGYGPNNYVCAYEVFGSETRTWQITDWVYGSNNSGGGALTTWPTNNFPTASALQWYAEGISTSFSGFSNGGQPGETPFNGAANTSKQICFDLALNVDPSVAAGTYTTTISYSIRIFF